MQNIKVREGFSQARLVLFLLIVPNLCLGAQSSYEKEEARIPTRPSTPPLLEQKVPIEYPHCERYFVYRGKAFECDSNLGRDAERLRVLLKDVPSALFELDTYQENREKIKVASYLGTAGILAMILGVLISRPPFDRDNGSIKPGGYVLLGGGILAGNSLIYGLSLVKTNESHLRNAVGYYNAAHPDDPIELQFSTRVNF